MTVCRLTYKWAESRKYYDFNPVG